MTLRCHHYEHFTWRAISSTGNIHIKNINNSTTCLWWQSTDSTIMESRKLLVQAGLDKRKSSRTAAIHKNYSQEPLNIFKIFSTLMRQFVGKFYCQPFLFLHSTKNYIFVVILHHKLMPFLGRRHNRAVNQPRFTVHTLLEGDPSPSLDQCGEAVFPTGRCDIPYGQYLK